MTLKTQKLVTATEMASDQKCFNTSEKGELLNGKYVR